MRRTYNPKAFSKLRKETLNITQREMAQWLECTVSTVQNYERGRSAPNGHSIDMLHHICYEKGINPPKFYHFKKVLIPKDPTSQ